MQPKYPPYLSKTTFKFLEQLLRKDPSKRLGSKKDAEDIKNHYWFSAVNWDDMVNMRYYPPFLPKFNNKTLGLEYFDKDFTQIPVESMEMTFDKGSYIKYDDFTWNPTSLTVKENGIYDAKQEMIIEEEEEEENKN